MSRAMLTVAVIVVVVCAAIGCEREQQARAEGTRINLAEAVEYFGQIESKGRGCIRAPADAHHHLAPDQRLIDGWGRDVDLRSAATCAGITLVSAGRDGTFATADDVAVDACTTCGEK